MELTKLTTCADREVRYYGLKGVGLISAVIFMIIIWANTSIIFGIMGASMGYLCGDILSRYWNKGRLQRWAYWYLPSANILGNRKFPESYIKEYV